MSAYSQYNQVYLQLNCRRLFNLIKCRNSLIKGLFLNDAERNSDAMKGKYGLKEAVLNTRWKGNRLKIKLYQIFQIEFFCVN